MKNPFRISLTLTAVLLLIAGLQYGSSRYDWSLPFAGGSYLGEPPTFEHLGADPLFPPECGEDTMNVGGGGYGMIVDLEVHAISSTAIVEGVARVSGPARFSGIEYLPRTKMEKAAGINTPFTITVSETHQGPKKSNWSVSEIGGQVGCFNYERYQDQIRLFDGAKGLFFIGGSDEFVGDTASMAIVENGPEWYRFTEENFGPIEDAVELIGSFE